MTSNEQLPGDIEPIKTTGFQRALQRLYVKLNANAEQYKGTPIPQTLSRQAKRRIALKTRKATVAYMKFQTIKNHGKKKPVITVASECGEENIVS